jgi:hypothetical protein
MGDQKEAEEARRRPRDQRRQRRPERIKGVHTSSADQLPDHKSPCRREGWMSSTTSMLNNSGSCFISSAPKFCQLKSLPGRKYLLPGHFFLPRKIQSS